MQLLETMKRIQNMKTPLNEETAKTFIVGPILEELGWDYMNRAGKDEVEFEKKVEKSGNKIGRLDIALLDSSKDVHPIVCFVEVKAPEKVLGQESIDQVIDYSFYEGVNLCVLTNTREWMFFLSKEDGAMRDRMFLHLDMDEDPEYLAKEFNTYLKKSNVLQKGYDAMARKRLLLARQERDARLWLPEIWKELCDKPDTDLMDLIAKKVRSDKGIELTHSQIASALFSERDADKSMSKSPDSSSNSGDNGKESDGKTERSKPIELSHMVINDKRYNVDSYVSMMAKVVDFLYKKYESSFMSKVSKEWIGKHPPISSDPGEKLASQFTKKKEWLFYIRTRASGFVLLRDANQLWKIMGEDENKLKLYGADQKELIAKSGIVIPID